MRLHANRVDRGVGAPTLSQLAEALGDLRPVAGAVGDVDHLDPAVSGHRQTLGDEVEADHPRAPVLGDPG